MRYRKVQRIISGILTAAMLTGQCPSVLAAGADEGSTAESTVIETDAGYGDEEEVAVTEEDTVSDDAAVEADTVSGDAVSDNEASEEEEIPAAALETPEEAVLPEADLEGLIADVDYVEGKLVAIADNYPDYCRCCLSVWLRQAPVATPL